MFNVQYGQDLQSENQQHGCNETNRGLLYQNLITYELQRCSSSGGFGFDLKGDRPAIIGSVRKESIAEQAGLKEGDLVISINNKKVTDLDHDQVVRLVGLSKNRLVLQVTKIAVNNEKSKQGSKTNSLKKSNGKMFKQPKKSSCKKLKNNSPNSASNIHSKANILPPPLPPPPLQMVDHHKEKQKHFAHDPDQDNFISYSGENIDRDNHFNSISNINNTKTTEGSDDESDYDYDLYLMTGRRRHRKHNKLNLTDNTNFTGDSSQTGDSMPSINFPKSPKKKTFQNYENPDQIVTYDEYQNQIDQEDENSDDFFDYDDDFTEDTVSTEDTEDNSTNYNEYGSSNFKQIRPIVYQGMPKTRTSRNSQVQSYQSSRDHHYHHHGHHHKRTTHSKHTHSNSERSHRHALNNRHHPATKRICKMSQHSPARPKTKSSSKSSKSQIPPPILTSTFQLQSQADNYVNIPKTNVNNMSSKHKLHDKIDIDMDTRDQISNDKDQQYDELIHNHQQIKVNRLYHKKHLQHQQELAYVKQIKYSNKLRTHGTSNENNSAPNQNYQNLNNNDDYFNLEKTKASHKQFLSYQSQQHPYQQQQHLKHIENVYRHHNMITNGSIPNNLVTSVSSNNINSNNDYDSSMIDSSIKANSSSSNLCYLQNANNNLIENASENQSLNDKFSINTTSDLSQNISRNLSQNENIQPIKSFIIKQNMNINMSKIANIKHFNLNNNNLQNMIKSSNSSNANINKLPKNQECNSNQLRNSFHRQAASCVTLGSNDSLKKLNVNDLYAILKPVIKPHIYDSINILNNNKPLELTMFFLGNLNIPYDTLSNASKLNSIRNEIEFFLTPTKSDDYQNAFIDNQMPTKSSTASALVNLTINTDNVKLVHKSAKGTQNIFFSNNLTNQACKTNKIAVYSKNQIGFCGKIKENCQIFALVLLSDANIAKNETENDFSNSQDSPDNSSDKNANLAKYSSSCCLVFRYVQNMTSNLRICLDDILNEISFIYRNEDCVFNMVSDKTASPKPATMSNSNIFQNMVNTPKITYDYAPIEIIPERLAVNLLQIQESENLEIIKTNMNYMSLNMSESEQNKSNNSFDKRNTNDGIILNKQTNDIYFKRMISDSNIACQNSRQNSKSDLKASRKIRHDRNGQSINSSSCSSNNLSNASAFMNKSNSSSHTNEFKPKKNLSKSNKIENQNISPKKLNNILNSEKKKSSSSSLDSNKFNREFNGSHKNFKSATLTTATFMKTLNNSEKKFQRNSEHTQSIKLIKENLANLFLSKKSNSSKSNNIESNGSGSTCSESADKIASQNKLDMPDDELLRAIEIETNKNINHRKKNKKNDQESNPTISSNEARGSSASISSEVGTAPSTKISLSNRLSAKFSTSKPKKSSSHQTFQFLRPKNNTNHNNVETIMETRMNCKEFNFEEEDFFDADNLINSIDIPQTNNHAKNKIMHGSSSAGKSNTTSRLSLPSNNGTANVYKPSTSKRLFNLISGVSSKNQQNQQQTERIQNFQANQQRRLSDFHRPAKRTLDKVIMN